MSASVLSAAMRSCLHDGGDLLLSLTDENYTLRCPEVLGASIGGHYRHTLDHFRNLLEAGENGLLDYDHRERLTPVETDRGAALEETRRLIELLPSANADWAERPLHVLSRVDYGGSDAGAVRSTAGREAVFCIMHAIHHYALIRVICGVRGVGLPANFGVAPSTAAFTTGLAA